MPNLTQGDSRPSLSAADVAKGQSNGSVVFDSRLTRPLWFDGRFLAARDLQREQNYFLQRQADLGRASGFGVISGLWVDTVTVSGTLDPATLIVRAGHGLTPAGEMVMIPRDLTIRITDIEEEEKLDVAFGIASVPKPPGRTRTGVYVLALRPVEFTANPITSCPTSIQGSRSVQDGDIVEASAVTLIPYPDPAGATDANSRRAVLARQIFAAGSEAKFSDSVLPLAMVSVQRGKLEWADPYLVRRENSPASAGIRFGLQDPATQQAFLLQYDAHLQQIAASLGQSNRPLSFAATDYFRALPPAGRFPLAGIDTGAFSQTFFPQQLDVRLSVIPQDELPALIEESLSLPPIDLTLPADAYTNLAVLALVPVPREGFAQLKTTLPTAALQPTLPQVLSYRQPLQLLRLYRDGLQITLPPRPTADPWAGVTKGQTYGFYIRRRSTPVFADFSAAPVNP